MSITEINIQPVLPPVGSNPAPGTPPLSATNAKVASQKDKIPTTTFWESHVGPHYDRLFKPMDWTDVAIIGTGVAIAAVIMTLAVTVFNLALFNILLLTSGAVAVGAYSISAIRVKKHHDAVAWEDVEVIRKNVMEADMPHHDLTVVQENFIKLRDSKVYTLKETNMNHIESLEKQIASYERAMKTPNQGPQYYEGARATFIAHLEGLQKTLSLNKSNERDGKIEADKVAARAEAKRISDAEQAVAAAAEAEKKKKAEAESKTEAVIVIEEERKVD